MSRYEVVCKCGHVGRGQYIEISFPVTADSKKDAAAIGRNIPRVKHHHKDAVLKVIEISNKEYFDLIEKNKNDPYLHCRNIQEQNCLDLTDRLVAEIKDDVIIDNLEQTSVFYKKTKVRKPKKFFKNLAMIERFNTEVEVW